MYNIEVGGSDRALTNTLTHNKEVVPIEERALKMYVSSFHACCVTFFSLKIGQNAEFLLMYMSNTTVL